MATYEWESVTIGQNTEIQKIVSAAAKASELLNTNIGLAKSGLQLAQTFLLGVLNPKILLLNAIADEIDNFVNDFKGTGFFLLEVTPTGKEIIPKDADGNPIKLLLTAPAIAVSYTAAAAVGQTAEFLLWTQDKLGIADYETEGAQNSSYAVVQGKAKSFNARTENANDNLVATKDPLFGMYKFTPSQVIAQTIAAIDDKNDEKRPQFSDSAEVGAIMLIVGYSDLSVNLKPLTNAITALVSFFGGEEEKDSKGNVTKAGGIFTKGFENMANILGAALGQLEDPEENKVDLIIDQVSGVRGNESEKHADARKVVGLPYNYEDQFEVNDFVVGPPIGFNRRALGYVSEIKETSTPDTNVPYKTQELTVIGASNLDANGFREAKGREITQASYFKKTTSYIDNNSGKPVPGTPFNHYKFFEELTNDEAKAALTKVERKSTSDSPDPFLTPISGNSTEDVTENVNGVIMRKVVEGKVREPKKGEAPPPNFKAARLEDLIGGFGDFFASVEGLADTLRNIAGDSQSALDDFIKYLNLKIKELDEINKNLQAVLKLFTTGFPDAGVYVLTVPPTVGGNNLIKSALQSATSRPPDTLDFSVGFMMMAGGPSMKVLNGLLNSE